MIALMDSDDSVNRKDHLAPHAEQCMERESVEDWRRGTKVDYSMKGNRSDASVTVVALSWNQSDAIMRCIVIVDSELMLVFVLAVRSVYYVQQYIIRD